MPTKSEDACHLFCGNVFDGVTIIFGLVDVGKDVRALFRGGWDGTDGAHQDSVIGLVDIYHAAAGQGDGDADECVMHDCL